MSFNKYLLKSKQAQIIIDRYVNADVIIGTQDQFTVIDEYLQSIGQDRLFDIGEYNNKTVRKAFKNADIKNIEEYLNDVLKPIGTLSASVGDVAGIYIGNDVTVGLIVTHKYALFAGSDFKFAMVSLKDITNVWRAE